MQAWLVPRNGNPARLASVLVSCLLILGFVYAGWTVIPWPRDVPAVRYGAPLPAAVPGPSRVLPVFVMRADRSVVRHGIAVREPDGDIGVRIFPTAAQEEPRATEVLLFEPGMTVLWAAATDSSRDELRRRLNALQDAAARTIERVITSTDFNQRYRPVLRSILTDAVTQAWEDPRTQSTLEDLLARSNTAFQGRLRSDLEEIMTSRVYGAMWEMARANWLNAFALPFGYDLDYAPVVDAVFATLLDPRIREVLTRFGSEQLATDEVRRLAERIVIGTADALMRDRRVPELVGEMAFDPNLRDMIVPLSETAMDLLAALPRHLGGLGAESGLNPLAAHIFKALILGQRTPLIMFVTPEDRQAIQESEPDAAIVLEPVGAAGRA